MKYLQFSLIVIVFTITLVSPAEIDNLVNTCPELGAKIISLQVTGCSHLPCTFVRGKRYEAKLTFSLGRNSTTIKIKCRGDPVIQGQFQDIADFEVCNGLSNGAKCPIVAGEPYTFGTNVTIPPIQQRTYTVKCEIVDDQNANEICVQGDAIIRFF